MILLQAAPITHSNLGFLPVLIPLFGIFVPFIIRLIENQSRLKQAKEFLELLKIREELFRLKDNVEETQYKIAIVKKLNLLDKELEEELYQKQKKKRIQPFVWLITAEIVFFTSGIYFGILSFFKTIIEGKSRENHVPFFEGIFADPAMRVFLILLYLMLSIIFLEKYRLRLVKKQSGPIAFNLTMVLVFNLLFVGFVTIGSLFLVILDELNPYF